VNFEEKSKILRRPKQFFLDFIGNFRTESFYPLHTLQKLKTFEKLAKAAIKTFQNFCMVTSN
jgi:hypothetical protein